MSITNELDWTPLAAVLRERADKLADDPETCVKRRDEIALFKALARILEGRSFYHAFGAPGDWGYGKPIGKALQTIYRGQRAATPPAAPTEPPADTSPEDAMLEARKTPTTPTTTE